MPQSSKRVLFRTNAMGPDLETYSEKHLSANTLMFRVTSKSQRDAGWLTKHLKGAAICLTAKSCVKGCGKSRVTFYNIRRYIASCTERGFTFSVTYNAILSSTMYCKCCGKSRLIHSTFRKRIIFWVWLTVHWSLGPSSKRLRFTSLTRILFWGSSLLQVKAFSTKKKKKDSVISVICG